MAQEGILDTHNLMQTQTEKALIFHLESNGKPNFGDDS
jgi:hypothetical protein